MSGKTRKSKQKGGKDFSGQNLTGEDFSGQDLARSNFSNSTLSQTKFMNAILTGTNFTGANLIEANLSNANLSNANLTKAYLTSANLTKADLTKADLTGANLRSANLTESILKNADLKNIDLTDAYLSGANLNASVLTGANLTRSILKGAHLNEANLTKADLTGATLYNANLFSANLTDAYLTGAYLTGAKLPKADLTGADLTGANLNHAYLTGAKLLKADLTGADLTGANLTKAILSNAILVVANLTTAHLPNANLSNANLSNANLFSADLTDAYLELANLTDANLTGANLTNTNLTNANLTGANLNNTILRGAIFKYAKMDRVILNDREKIKKISNKTNFSRTRLEKKNILNAKSKSKKNLAHIVSFFRKTKIYKPLIEKIYDGIKKKSIQIDNNKRKKIENILSNTVINSIVNNNNEDFINISNDKKLLKKNTYTPEEINKIITAFYKNKIYKKKLEVLLSRTNLSNEEKLLIEAITNKTNIIPTLKTDKSKYNSVYYDPIIGQYIFIIPAGTLFFRGSKTEEEETKIPDILYTYSVPTMCFGVKGFNFRYNIIYVVKAIKDLKFIISILPSPKSRHNLRKDKLIFSNNERSKNLSELQGNMLYSEKNDPSLHKDIRKYSNIDGIISIAGMDSFYEGYSKELRSMSDWLKRSVQLGVPTEYYISHMNIDSSSNIGYPEYVIYSDNSDSKNNANTKIEYIMTISSDKPKASNESIIELCQKLFEYLSNTRVGELYWDKRTGNFFDFKGYNKNEKYFTKYDTDLTLKHVLLEIDGDITTILNNSKPLEGTLTKIQYITKDLCDKIHEIITTPTNISVLSKININNKKFKFQNRENRENFSGGHGQELMTLSINEAYAKYLIPIPYSLFVEQNIEDFS